MNIGFGYRIRFIVGYTILLLQTSYPAIAQKPLSGNMEGSLAYLDKDKNSIELKVPQDQTFESIIKKRWPSESIITESPTETPIESPDVMLPLQGNWNWDGSQLRQLNTTYNSTYMIFEPVVNYGHIKLKTRLIEGDEGARIIFGYQSKDQFFNEIRIGYNSNKAITITKNYVNGNENLEDVIVIKQFNIKKGQWYNIQVSIDGTQGAVRCDINGNTIIEYKIAEPFAGRFGVGTTYSSADFSNISIFKSNLASPATGKEIRNNPTATLIQNQPPKPKKTFSYIKQRFEDIGFDAQWDENTNRGFLVNAVTWNSSASKSGLRSDDLIVSIKNTKFGKEVESTENKEFAQKAIYGLGDLPWQITIERAGNEEPIGLILQPLNQISQFQPTNIRQSFNTIQNMPRSLMINQPAAQAVTANNLKDDKLLNDKNWPDTPLEKHIKVDESCNTIAFRGNWDINGATIHQTQLDAAPATLIFEPIIEPIGEIRLKARVIKGNEGIRIIFAYAASNQYLVWNIGGWENKKMLVEKWFGLDQTDQHVDLTVWQDLILEHNKWHDIRLVIDAGKSIVKGYLNGKRELLMTTNEPLSGRIGLGTWNTEVEYKDIHIIGGKDFVDAVK